MRKSCLRILLLLTAASAAAGPVPRYLPARRIVVEYQAANGVEVAAAELWVSTDGCATWSRPADVTSGPATLVFTAPADGRYDLFLVLHGAAGGSGPPPVAGCEPIATAIIDTAPPLLQVHGPYREGSDESASVEPGVVQLAVTLIEENLSDSGVRVHYRTPNGQWVDGGVAAVADGRLAWRAPPTRAGALDLRIVATDRAGNRAAAEVAAVPIPAAPATQAAGPPGTAGQASGGEAAGMATAVAPVAPPQVEGVHVAPVAPVTGPGAAPAAAADGAAPGLGGRADDLRALRELATKFMSEGRYSLAAARLEDALELAPQDADLLVDLGSALYRLGRHEDADRRFRSALGAAPDHAGALDGLALVAATQRRYPEARAHLRELLRLRPQSGLTWLRAGDIEHRLGRTSEALRAWEQVLRVADADAEVRAMAERRLDYFRPPPPPRPLEQPPTDGQGSQVAADRRDLRG